MRYRTWLAVGSALAWGSAALAGDKVLYEPAPDWVVRAQLPADRSGPPIVLYDDQRRLEEGRLTSYVDRAIRIDNPQMLNAAGTVQAGWLPDKGDLVVHDISIRRGDETIDVLAQGATFDVLRRERMLEQRMIDGVLTATLAVPGLRVGDVLRMSYSVTLSDQALGKEVQAFAPLPAAPFEAGFARVRMSWPEGSDVTWRASNNAPVTEMAADAGYKGVEVALPLPEPPPMPGDAPARFQMPAMLQAGSFANWQEVSRVMAPHYATEGSIAAGGPIAEQVRRIKADHSGQLDRAVAALRLVQDEIAYLANGMNGGNYLPQAPADTWDMRYGDCKAKTMLLLAMLRDMGIKAEPAVVASATGDALPEMLPMPGAFDHIIVRAEIGGTEYWLDGTSSGASMANVAEVPPFHYALPLRNEGADLIPVAQRAQQTFDIATDITFDHRAGLDVPTIFDAEWTLSGQMAGQVRSVIGQGSEEQINDFLLSFTNARLGNSSVINGMLSYDDRANTALVSVKGIVDSPWGWERGKGSRQFGLPTSGFGFRPDRARSAWRDIPVAIPGPYAENAEVTVLLPQGQGDYTLEGNPAFEQEIASIRLAREAKLNGGSLKISDRIAWPGGELAPAAIAGERSRASRFNTDLRLVAPANAPRRYDAAGGDRARFKPLEDAFARIIEKKPDEAESYQARANFRSLTYDREGAVDDLSRVIDLQPTADVYLQRSGELMELGRFEEAYDDTVSAADLDPSARTQIAQANALQYLGRTEEGIALLADAGQTPDERSTAAMQLSELQAYAGRKDEGLQTLVDDMAARPGDPNLLNAQCWYRGTWDYQTDGLIELCTQAVEQANWSAAALDSRAMAYFRLGRFDEALRDLDAALIGAPDQTASIFMRGVVLRAKGDAAGERDIRAALARNPSLEPYFARFGIEAR